MKASGLGEAVKKGRTSICERINQGTLADYALDLERRIAAAKGRGVIIVATEYRAAFLEMARCLQAIQEHLSLELKLDEQSGGAIWINAKRPSEDVQTSAQGGGA